LMLRSLTGFVTIMEVFRKKQKRNPHLSRAQALDCKPVKNIHVKATRLDTGEILLTYAAAMRPWLAGLIRRFGGPSDRSFTKKLQLDELGTQMWDLIDGSTTVQSLIQRFAEDYQLHLKEAEVSVSRFLRELGRRGIIGLRELDDGPGES
jgi:hypothetical protein